MKALIEVSVDIPHLLASRGYAVAPGTAYRLSTDTEAALARLRSAYAGLPPDSYLTDGGAYRHRRFDSFAVSSSTVVRKPSRPYYQSPEVNRFAGGMARKFPPLAPEVQDNEFLSALLRFNAAQLPANGDAWHVDVHMVRVTASPDHVGRPSPEGIHRDGFDYVSIHLVNLVGAPAGGVTEVLEPDGGRVASTRLAQRLDSVYLDDRSLLHDVTPLVAVTGPAHRDVLLMSYRRDDKS